MKKGKRKKIAKVRHLPAESGLRISSCMLPPRHGHSPPATLPANFPFPCNVLCEELATWGCQYSAGAGHPFGHSLFLTLAQFLARRERARKPAPPTQAHGKEWNPLP